MSWLERQTARFTTTTTAAPHLRSRWSIERISLVGIVAMLPPLVVVWLESPGAVLQRLLLALAVVVAWQLIFGVLRHRRVHIDGLATALTFTVMTPPDAALWQLFLGLSFGVVIGEHVFGGRGWSFMPPVVVAIAVLDLSFPDAGYNLAHIDSTLAAAAVPGAVVLLATGLISWRVLVGAVAAMLAIGWWVGLDDPVMQLATGYFAFAVVFIACDPVTSSSTNPGRWIYGLVVGALAALGRSAGAGDGTVMAILLASVFAPLIDQAVIAANLAWRRRRYG